MTYSLRQKGDRRLRPRAKAAWDRVACPRSFALRLSALALFLCGASLLSAAPPKPTDALGRTNPRSAVTGFLQACTGSDYQKASEYLDLRNVAPSKRASQGPQLAKGLESILNSDTRFNVLRLSQDPQGNLTDDPNPNLEHVASVSRYGQTFTLELERMKPSATQPQIWLFTPATVAAIPRLRPLVTTSGIEAHLPRFLVVNQFLQTPIWKWIALFILFLILIFVFRYVVRLLVFILRAFQAHWRHPARWIWVSAMIEPWMLFLFAIGFGIVSHIVSPSALARMYIGRTILLAIVAAFAWFV
ncbi:MAG: hypothetical protein ACRD34_12475, partial [Bryobacteraceae bacterium]